ncbi:Rap1a/Tai family immunity protein [Massilia sp. GCM10020059]|uniref:Rap1a immunity protein domain-containing protein n=1 Tax=Massilia agrisoli TaxID=2892444 RepID=A0ABS8ISF4_9BURK|nr:hypothetical protein [Massilia agrisoli]
MGPSKFDRTAQQQYDLQYVDGYLAGVADATEGKEWCDTHKVKAHEIDAYLVWALKDMPPEQLQRTAAAKLMVALLAKRFPCTEGMLYPVESPYKNGRHKGALIEPAQAKRSNVLSRPGYSGEPEKFKPFEAHDGIGMRKGMAKESGSGR